MLNSAPPANPEWDAKLEKERLDEIRVISNACTVLGRELHEVSLEEGCAPDAHLTG